VNPDGTISYQNGNGNTFTTKPGGTSVVTGPTGLTTVTDASGQKTTTKANGAPATPQDIQAANSASNGPIGGGGILGLGDGIGGVARTTINAVGGVTPGGAILGYAPPGSPAADVRKGVQDATGMGGGTGGGGNVDTSAVSAAAAHARELSDKFLADYNNAHPGEPPVTTAAQLPPAVQAAMPPAVKAGFAAQGAPIQASTANATLIDPSTGLQFRQGQEGLIGTLNDAISGKAPSVAALQLEQTRQNNAANQLGLAAKASGGGNTFLALQNAANQAGRINAQAGADAAVLRAKEIADARGQLGGVLDQARGGDITIGAKNADLSTGVNMKNAELQTGAASDTAKLIQATNAANAGNETSANVATGNIVKDILQGNRDATNLQATNQGRFQQDTNQANLDAATKQRALDETQRQNSAANALTGSGQAITGSVGAAQAQAAAAAAKAQADAAKIGGYAAGGAALLNYLK